MGRKHSAAQILTTGDVQAQPSARSCRRTRPGRCEWEFPQHHARSLLNAQPRRSGWGGAMSVFQPTQPHSCPHWMTDSGQSFPFVGRCRSGCTAPIPVIRLLLVNRVISTRPRRCSSRRQGSLRGDSVEKLGIAQVLGGW